MLQHKTLPSTFSKTNASYGLAADIVLLDGYDSTLVFMVNGKAHRVTDWVSGLGTNLLGYKTLKRHWGWSPSVMTEDEQQLGHILGEWVAELLGWDEPGLVKLCSTGSEATHMAARIARAVTHENGTIGYFAGHYHGWLDDSIQRTFPARGVIKNHRTASYRWMKDTNFLQHQLSGLIFEHPVGTADPEWYDALNAVKGAGTILIADEVVTGFRYNPGLISAAQGIQPDLVCLGKALSNGARLGAVVGKPDIMKEAFLTNSPVFVSSTTHGEVSAIKQALDTIRFFKTLPRDYLFQLGSEARQALTSAGVDTWGDNERFHFTLDTIQLGQFIRGCFQHGHLVGRVNLVNYAHKSGDAQRLERAARQVLDKLSIYTGPTPQVLFKDR